MNHIMQLLRPLHMKDMSSIRVRCHHIEGPYKTTRRFENPFIQKIVTKSYNTWLSITLLAQIHLRFADLTQILGIKPSWWRYQILENEPLITHTYLRCLELLVIVICWPCNNWPHLQLSHLSYWIIQLCNK